MSVGSEVSSDLTLKDLLGRDCLFFAGYILLITFQNMPGDQKFSSSKFR